MSSKQKVLLHSPILVQAGYGENGREILRALKRYEDYFDIYLHAINWGNNSWIHDDNEERHYIDSLIMKTAMYEQQCQGNPQYDTSIQCTIPNEFKKMARNNIGWTAGIEANKIAPQWISAANQMDKVVVVSNHAKFGFENTSYQAMDKTTGQTFDNFRTLCPISVIGYPVRKHKKKDIDLNLKTDFNFLAAGQWSTRKYLPYVLKWFAEEFWDNPNVGLVLKVHHRNGSIMDRFATKEKLLANLKDFDRSKMKCKIYFLHGDMTDEELTGLYQHPKIKVFCSLSNEGFGLHQFESAYNGIPIIATNWGGPLDFLCMPTKKKDKKTGKIETIMKPMFAKVDYDLKPIQKDAVWDGVLVADSQWAYPKPISFKMRLREVYKEYDRYLAQAKKLKKYLCETFTEEKIYKQIAEEVLGEKIVEIDANDIPKTSLITSVWKGSQFLESYFKDIERQTFFPKGKIEVLIGHPKNSPEFKEEESIISKWVGRYPDVIKYFQLGDDKGLYNVWNQLLEKASGEYISNWNLDDRRKENCVERCAKELFLEKDVDGAYFDQMITDQFNETFEKNTAGERRYNFPNFSFENLKILNLLHAMPMWKKNLHDKYGGFEEKYKSASDWEFFLRCSQKGAIFKKIDGILGLYCFNEKGISTNIENNEWKMKEETEIYNFYKDLKVEEKKK